MGVQVSLGYKNRFYYANTVAENSENGMLHMYYNHDYLSFLLLLGVFWHIMTDWHHICDLAGMYYPGPYTTSPLSLGSCCWPQLWALHNQIRTTTLSPIREFRSNLIWLLHSVSSLPYLLLHRLLKSPTRKQAHTGTHTHRHTHHSSLSPLNKHRTLWPNLVLVAAQKALYKV